jgi:hypothetical protein
MKHWIKSQCKICGKTFEHLSKYQPVTCGKYDCLQEANKRNLLNKSREAN